MIDRGYTSIDNVIREYLAGQGYNTLHEYMISLMFALEGLRKWNKSSGKMIKTVMIPMDNKRFVRYPKDYLGYCKIGLPIGDRIVTFTKDNSISLHHDTTTKGSFINQLYGASLNFTYVYDFINFRTTNGQLGALIGYGWGHNGVGFYKEGANGFQFSSEVKKCSIYMEYISDGFDPDSQTLVNAYAAELIRDYMWYCKARFELGDSHRETKSRYQKYLDEYDDIRAFLSDVSYEGILHATSRAVTLAPKQ